MTATRAPARHRRRGHAAPARILVIGDIILDRYVWGGGGRGGGPPALVLRATGRPGRAAGFGPLLRGPGARATLVGVVGDDPEGWVVRRLLDAAGLPRVAPPAPRRHRAARLNLARWLPTLVADHDSTRVSAYARDAGGPGLLADVLARADAAGRPVLVDPAAGGDNAAIGGATPRPAAGWGIEAIAVTLDAADPTLTWGFGEGPAAGRGRGGLVLVVPGAFPAAGAKGDGGRRRAAARRPGPAATAAMARIEGEGRRCRAT